MFFPILSNSLNIGKKKGKLVACRSAITLTYPL